MGSAFAVSDNLQLVGYGPNSWTVGSDYLGPYPITVNGATMSLACDDYRTNISLWQTWTATPYGGSDVADTKFYGQGAFGTFISGNYGSSPTSGTQAYEEAFYLTYNMMKPSVQANQSTLTAINLAIWYLMDPNISTASLPSGNSTQGYNTSYWLTQAQNNYQKTVPYLNDFTVYTPNGPNGINSSQEFIGFKPACPVPIPAPLLFFAPGLLGLVGMRKRFKM
jgi:hypothetical protein